MPSILSLKSYNFSFISFIFCFIDSCSFVFSSVKLIKSFSKSLRFLFNFLLMFFSNLLIFSEFSLINFNNDFIVSWDTWGTCWTKEFLNSNSLKDFFLSKVCLDLICLSSVSSLSFSFFSSSIICCFISSFSSFFSSTFLFSSFFSSFSPLISESSYSFSSGINNMLSLSSKVERRLFFSLFDFSNRFTFFSSFWLDLANLINTSFNISKSKVKLHSKLKSYSFSSNFNIFLEI